MWRVDISFENFIWHPTVICSTVCRRNNFCTINRSSARDVRGVKAYRFPIHGPGIDSFDKNATSIHNLNQSTWQQITIYHETIPEILPQQGPSDPEPPQICRQTCAPFPSSTQPPHFSNVPCRRFATSYLDQSYLQSTDQWNVYKRPDKMHTTISDGQALPAYPFFC